VLHAALERVEIVENGFDGRRRAAMTGSTMCGRNPSKPSRCGGDNYPINLDEDR